jgi:hypothetical protein
MSNPPAEVEPVGWLVMDRLLSNRRRRERA